MVSFLLGGDTPAARSALKRKRFRIFCFFKNGEENISARLKITQEKLKIIKY